MFALRHLFFLIVFPSVCVFLYKVITGKMGKHFDKSPDVVFAGGDATLLAPLVLLRPVSYPNLVLNGIALIKYQQKPVTEP